MPIFVGPFFVIDKKVIANKIALQQAERYGDKLTSPFSHADLYDSNFSKGEYMHFPRGRVVWDTTRHTAIVYIDKCIETNENINNIIQVFNLGTYVIDYDNHYTCPNCSDYNFIFAKR